MQDSTSTWKLQKDGRLEREERNGAPSTMLRQPSSPLLHPRSVHCRISTPSCHCKSPHVHKLERITSWMRLPGLQTCAHCFATRTTHLAVRHPLDLENWPFWYVRTCALLVRSLNKRIGAASRHESEVKLLDPSFVLPSPSIILF